MRAWQTRNYRPRVTVSGTRHKKQPSVERIDAPDAPDLSRREIAKLARSAGRRRIVAPEDWKPSKGDRREQRAQDQADDVYRRFLSGNPGNNRSGVP